MSECLPVRGPNTDKQLAEADRERGFAIRSAPALMSYVDKNLCYRWANRTYEQWFGKPLDRIVGCTLREVVGDELLAIIQPWINKVLAGEQVQYESTLPMPDGRLRTLQFIYTPDLDAAGAVLGFSVLATDVAEKQRLRELVTEGSERLHQAVTAAKLGTWEYHPQTDELVWSDRCKELFGMTKEDAIDFEKNIAGIFVDDREATTDAVAKALDPNGSGNYDVEFRTVGFRDGVIRWVHAAGQAFFKDGKAIKFIGTVEDITERKQVEDALRESEQFTRSVLDSSPDCVKIMDLQGKLLSLNKNGCALMEVEDVNSCLNVAWSRLWGANEHIAENALEEARQGRTTHFEGYCETWKKNPRWWDVVVIPIRDGSGKVVRVMAISRDITERHRAEQERQRLTVELERSNADLSQFAHIAAHDLQSPLRMIRIYTQLLERQLRPQLDEPSKEFIRVVLNGSERMEKLISSLLEYAQAGESERKAQLVPMATVVSEALSNLEVSIHEHSAEISCGELPVVRGDAVQLMQVVQNTVGNSIKYRRADVPLKIQIGAVRQESMWRFSVEDNGQGIASQYLEQVFKPFKRLHGQEIAGTGMGLAVCRKIVERHDGNMWVESEEGAGARFYFTLPVEGSENRASSIAS